MPTVSKCEVVSGPYFPLFSPNTGKYGAEITPYLDNFHSVLVISLNRWNYTVATKLLKYFQKDISIFSFFTL